MSLIANLTNTEQGLIISSSKIIKGEHVIRNVIKVLLVVSAVVGLSALAMAVSNRSAPTTATASSECLYLTKDVTNVGGVNQGQFFVLQLSGEELSGYTGAFGSEWSGVRGHVDGNVAKLQIENPYKKGEWRSVSKQWLPDENRLSGWDSVSKAQLGHLSGDGSLPLDGRICA